MPIRASDFAASRDDIGAERSARYDPERPFLFDGLSPRYATRRVRGVQVPMRDGVQLSTDFHVPLGAELPLPVVLVRTPYNKNTPATAMPALLTEQGIVYAIQDVRGRHESEGVFLACTGQDREDGWDTLDWLVAQPWCNGAVGTLGSSYTGETAAKIAATRHPAHRCSVIMFDGSYAGGASRNGAFLQGGVTLFRMLATWFRDFVPGVSYGPPPHVDRAAWFADRRADLYATQPVRPPGADLEQHLRTLPVHDLLDRAGAAPSDFGEMMRRANDPSDPYWAAQRFLTDEDRFAAPALFVTGPLERGGSSFDNFRLFRENATNATAREHQYLWFTPAAHSAYAECGEDTRLGARTLGDTRFPYYRDLVGWFAHWLRGDPLDLASWPKVRYFVQGRGWARAETWPPESSREIRLYLRAPDGGDGSMLDRDPPRDDEPAGGFTYDPGDPTPSEPPGTTLDLLGVAYVDRAAIDARDDVLTYITAAFAEPFEIAGPVRAELHVSSSALDTDFVAVLSEVTSDGRVLNITHGVARMRYRDGLDRPTLLEPGRITPVTIDLWHAAIAIPVGHRLRLSVSSAHFPTHERNLNTGGDNFIETTWVVAHNRIHHGPAHASALVLAVR